MSETRCGEINARQKRNLMKILFTEEPNICNLGLGREQERVLEAKETILLSDINLIDLPPELTETSKNKLRNAITEQKKD